MRRAAGRLQPLRRCGARAARPAGAAVLSGVILLTAAPLMAQEVTQLEIGDPARRDQKVAVVLDAIIDSHTAETLTPAEVAAQLGDVRLLLAGESHDSMEAHRAQLAIIRALVEAGRQVMVGLEMYPFTEQPHLDQWNEGLLTEKGFVELSRWYENWGFNWGYYRDIFLYAHDNGVPVVGVNTPRWVVSAVGQKGVDGLSEEERRYVPPRIDTDNDDHLRLFRAYIGPTGSGHGGGDAGLSAMFQAQCTWDAAMAYNAVQALQKNPGAIMVVLVGSGHVAYGLGIQRQAALWFDGKVATLIAVPISEAEAVQASYADFIWGVAPEPEPRFPDLGISTRQETPDDGVRIILVPPGSALHPAGVSAGDTIVAMDGVPVPDRLTLNRLVAGKRWGDAVSLELERDGERRTVEVVLRRRIQRSPHR